MSRRWPVPCRAKSNRLFRPAAEPRVAAEDWDEEAEEEGFAAYIRVQALVLLPLLAPLLTAAPMLVPVLVPALELVLVPPPLPVLELVLVPVLARARLRGPVW